MKNLKHLREARGWKQVDLAERTGLKQSMISKIESGAKPTFTYEIQKKIADVLGVEIKDLFE